MNKNCENASQISLMSKNPLFYAQIFTFQINDQKTSEEIIYKLHMEFQSWSKCPIYGFTNVQAYMPVTFRTCFLVEGMVWEESDETRECQEEDCKGLCFCTMGFLSSQKKWSSNKLMQEGKSLEEHFRALCKKNCEFIFCSYNFENIFEFCLNGVPV